MAGTQRIVAVEEGDRELLSRANEPGCRSRRPQRQRVLSLCTAALFSCHRQRP